MTSNNGMSLPVLFAKGSHYSVGYQIVRYELAIIAKSCCCLFNSTVYSHKIVDR